MFDKANVEKVSSVEVVVVDVKRFNFDFVDGRTPQKKKRRTWNEIIFFN